MQQKLTYGNIAKRFVKIGSTSFSGWSTTALLIEKEFIDSGILQAHQLKAAIAYAQIIPGATQAILVSHVGHSLRGVRGAVTATLSYLLPSVLLMTVFAALYFRDFHSAQISNHIGGLVAALAGVILANAYRIGSKHASTMAWWLVAIAVFVARLFFGVDALILILVAGGGTLTLSWRDTQRSKL